MSGGRQFHDWGARRVLLLAIVRKVPESAYNLQLIFEAIQLNKLQFKLTGDFAFFMPGCGIVKGCGSGNPCPLCDQERSKQGRWPARWLEENEISLRSFGSLLTNYTAWVLEGEKPGAVHTKKWKSVTGEVLIRGVSDSNDTFIINKIIPGPLHLFLSVNEIFNFCESHGWPEIKAVLKEVAGVEVHMYMGKVGNYEGPSIRKVFRKLDELKQHSKVHYQLQTREVGKQLVD